MTLTHDDNGTLAGDGVFKYTYDAWILRVNLTASGDTDVAV